MPIDLQTFKSRSDWVKVWSGKWSFHSCSQFGQEWTVDNLISSRPAYPRVIYLSRLGISDCWVSLADKDDLCARLTAGVRQDSRFIQSLADDLRAKADAAMAFFDSRKPEASRETYQEFWQKISDYYLPHLEVKYIVDYLSPEEMERYLPVLEAARLYAEPVFRNQENFMEGIAAAISNISGLKPASILATAKEELLTYFDGRPLPGEDILLARHQASAQVFELGRSEVFSGSGFGEIEKIVSPISGESLKGQIAYRGRASGTVRVVIDPFTYDGPFDEGDILVAGMTRPEFLPLMKKAAAFVTDAGGILSHAAIVAREMKKPCLIGTQTATKAFKDGDRVEVDAEQGIVRKI